MEHHEVGSRLQDGNSLHPTHRTLGWPDNWAEHIIKNVGLTGVPAQDDGGQRPAGGCGGVEVGGPPAGVPAGEPSRAAGRPPEPLDLVRLADGHGRCADAAVPAAVGLGVVHRRHASAGAGIGEMPSGPAVGVLLAVRDGLRCDAGPVSRRPGQVPGGVRGYLQCDAYAGYNEVFALARGKVIEVGCWAHARRKFVEAENSALLESHEAVARIRALYQIEESIKGLDAAGKLAARVRDAVPLLENLKAWLDKVKARSLPKSRLMEAVNYALNQWDALVAYTTNGDCAIDNNTAERAVKPFAIGRKNWLFFGSDRGGRALAILASFTET